MLFNSLTFLVFLACVLALHSLPLPWRVKKLNLLLASYVFYAAWNPPFIVLLWISTVVAWLTAKAMAASRSQATRRLFLCLSLAVDLGLLGYFKYASFALESFARLLYQAGIAYQPPVLDVVLPIGISFYTFHTLSYTIDVYRGVIRPWHSFLDFALYVAFFPQLVAGPITRARQFLPQCVEPKRATPAEFAWGVNLLVIGLFSKIVLADKLFRPVVDAVYKADVKPDMGSAWCGTLAFGSQIYCDFAGYSTCAIGAAMCLGFALPDNFHWPLAPVGFVDFWRRWHMSLSNWMRDYVFIPLGGGRCGRCRSAFNILATMFLMGLWHGAAWTFVLFGLLHGVGLVVETNLRRSSLGRQPFWMHPIAQLGLALLTVFIIAWIRVFFRAQTIGQAADMVLAMAGHSSTAPTFHLSETQFMWSFFPAEVLFVTHFLLRDMTLEQVVAKCPAWIWGAGLTAMLTAILTMPGEEQAFIYFQF